MADSDIAGLNAQTAASVDEANDPFAIYDNSGTGTDKTKKMLPAELRKLMLGNYREIYINVGAMIPNTTAGTGPSANTTETATNDVMVDRLDFSTSVDQSAGVWVVMPQEWDAGTIKCVPHWTANGGTGNVEFEFSGRAYADSDAIDQAMGTAQSSTDTLLTAGDMHIGPATAAITIAGTPVAGEPVYIKVLRDTSVDTLGVDAGLIGFRIQYKESITGTTIL
jgi:hypothetical protein